MPLLTEVGRQDNQYLSFALRPFLRNNNACLDGLTQADFIGQDGAFGQGRTEGKKGSDRVFAVSASDVNEYLEKASPEKITAKDFRTFHASSMAFSLLQDSAPPPKISSKEADKIIAGVVEKTSKFLGNTPTICKQKYINPRVIDAYRNRVVQEAA